jgi:protocatechuate 3,4-dioxygenase beta subunit
MKTMARAKQCLLLCVFSAALFAQAAGRGVISGTVVDASSGDPVRKAVVTATWQGTPRAWATTRTDGSGRFTIEGLPPGSYDLRAGKAGLGTAIYGANSLRELGDLITLGDGETRADLNLRFLRSASVSGRVLGPDGDPVSGIRVNLLRASRSLGDLVLMNYRGAMTDDRGEYKIASVDQGEYYLHCAPQQFRMGGGTLERMASQFLGGARDSKDAPVLSLRGGEVLSGLDFHLTAQQAAKIIGRVTGVPVLDPPVETPGRATRMKPDADQQVSVNLSPADEYRMSWMMGAPAHAPDFRFELGENNPGRYRLQATVHVWDKTYYASQLVDAGEGTTDVELAMSPGLEVKGHLKVEGPAAPSLDNVTVRLAPAGSGPNRQSYSSPVAKDGSFKIEQVPPGEWLLTTSANSAEIFEKFVRLGDKDFLYKRLELPPGSDAPLNIVLSSNAATVEGEIDAGKRAGILLEPVGQRHTMTNFYYSAIADDQGKFKVSGIAPGKYKIFALEKIATANYRTPEAADALDGLGEEVDLVEGAKVQLQPKLIPEEKARELLKP